MNLHTHIPSFPLSQFIDCFTHIEGYNSEYSLFRFLPDGNAEIIIDFDDTPKYIYDNQTLKEIQACHHVWTSGVRTQPISIPSGKHTAKLIISFKKGMAYPFFPMPMHEISDCVVDADLLWGNVFAYLRERLLEIKEVNSRFECVEEFLLKTFHTKFITNPCVEYAVSEILRQSDQVNLGRLNQKIGYSQRHFIEMFKRQVGVTPKGYLKIIRFQKTINKIEECDDIDWTPISQECGFYDQSHFIRDFRFFSGFTPSEYLRLKSNLLNYVPVG